MPVVSDINADKYQSAGRHQTIRRQTSENSILERKRDNPAAFGGIQNLSPPKGWQRNWIRRGAKRPENPVTCFPVEKRLTTFCASLCSYKMCSLCTPKGETTHYILRVASAPSPSAVTDSLDFQVADAPLQIQFASAKCVRCAPKGATTTLGPKARQT